MVPLFILKDGGGLLNTQVMVPVLTVLCTVLSLIVGFLTFNRNRDKDVKSDASQLAVIQTKLENIDQGVRDIQVETRATAQRVSEMSERLTRVEESSKQAHKRLDKFENKGE
ncbi:hypothetical protein [Neobacillus vireti]|uniref:hypothetical protein n=1 Tax=Neobacillus vireti TaxID=220686 RepID=UPI002FFE603D